MLPAPHPRERKQDHVQIEAGEGLWEGLPFLSWLTREAVVLRPWAREEPQFARLEGVDAAAFLTGTPLRGAERVPLGSRAGAVKAPLSEAVC